MKDTTIAMLAIGMLGAWNAACAQTRERAVEPEQVAEWLSSTEREHVRTASLVITSAFGWDRDAYSPHERSVFIADLLALIVSVRDDQAPSVSSMRIAAGTLSIIVKDSVEVREEQDLPELLLRGYDDTESVAARGVIMSLLVDLLPSSPSHRNAIEALLERIVTSGGAPGNPSPWGVIHALEAAGAHGDEILRSYHARNVAVDGPIRGHLNARYGP